MCCDSVGMCVQHEYGYHGVNAANGIIGMTTCHEYEIVCAMNLYTTILEHAGYSNMSHSPIV